MHISSNLLEMIRNILLTFIFVLLVNGFAQAEQNRTVIMIVGAESPAGCELLGKVTGSSKEGEVQENNVPYTERLMKARNNLKDEALKLGGDTVHIIRSNNTGKYEIPGGDKEIIHIGNVYRCK